MSSATDEKPRATAETPAGPPPPAGGGEGGGRDLETGATVAAAAGSSGSSRERLAPSASFTGHQLFYVFALDGFGGMALSAGVNFALAYVMYTTQDTQKSPIRLWQFPNTLAGDAAVTVFVQCILTWFVEMALVSYDLSKRSVQPIGFVPEPTGRWLRWLCLLPVIEELPQHNSTGAKPRGCCSALPALQQLLRGFMLSVVAFVLLWPAAVGILTAFGEKQGGDRLFEDRWTPQFFKFALGGLLGLLTTPLMAMFWLVKAGWEAKNMSGQ